MNAYVLIGAAILALALVFPSDTSMWQQKVNKAAFVLVGEVKEVQPSLGSWSGQYAIVQKVKFKIVKVLKGKLNSSEIEVGFYIVKNSPLVDAEQPSLSPKLFKAGNQFILLLQRSSRGNDANFSADKVVEAVVASEDMIRTIESSLHRKH